MGMNWKRLGEQRHDNLITFKGFNQWQKEYPLFSQKELLTEIRHFHKDFIDGGIISAMSSNFHKYLRGYLVRAYREKQRTSGDAVQTFGKKPEKF